MEVHNMANVRVQITLDEKLLKMIDEKAESLFTSRSGYISMTMAQIILGEHRLHQTFQNTLEKAADEESQKKLR